MRHTIWTRHISQNIGLDNIWIIAITLIELSQCEKFLAKKAWS